MELTTPRHLWIFPAWFTTGWWDRDVDFEVNANFLSMHFTCSREQVSLGRTMYIHNKFCNGTIWFFGSVSLLNVKSPSLSLWGAAHDKSVCLVQMREAVKNSFFVDSYLYGTDKDQTTDTGTVSQKYRYSSSLNNNEQYLVGVIPPWMVWQWMSH